MTPIIIFITFLFAITSVSELLVTEDIPDTLVGK